MKHDKLTTAPASPAEDTDLSTRVLFVSSEVSPVMKTGGLGEVAGSLPAALAELGDDVLVMMPAYRYALERMGPVEKLPVALDHFGEPVEFLKGRLPRNDLPVLLVAIESLFDRPGNPYLGPDGESWPDNADRFCAFARAVAEVAMDRVGMDWQPELVHCNDWQSALVPALLAQEEDRPATMFTIHNLAYQGVFPTDVLDLLQLPESILGMDGLEFHGQISFMKGGLLYADRVTTVSATYAREIQTEEYGCGLDGVLTQRAEHLSGILNGIDIHVWDPASDPKIAAHYDREDLDGKQMNKQALQKEMGLPEVADVPIYSMIARLIEQKGIDLVIDAVPSLLKLQVQLVILGDGEARFEQALRDLAEEHPEQVAVYIGYNEGLAHRITAGSDVFLMPSRFEPCGLTQMHCMRYGTPPIVRATGGLADTVRDVGMVDIDPLQANGFVFEDASVDALLHAMGHARVIYDQPERWRTLQQVGMDGDYTWLASAIAYRMSYQQAIAERTVS